MKLKNCQMHHYCCMILEEYSFFSLIKFYSLHHGSLDFVFTSSSNQKSYFCYSNKKTPSYSESMRTIATGKGRCTQRRRGRPGEPGESPSNVQNPSWRAQYCLQHSLTDSVSAAHITLRERWAWQLEGWGGSVELKLGASQVGLLFMTEGV